MENTNLQIVQQCNEIKILSEEEKKSDKSNIAGTLPQKNYAILVS